MTAFVADPDPAKSIAQCYAILPPNEAWAIWARCPLPAYDPSKQKKRDDDDDPDIYLA